MSSSKTLLKATVNRLRVRLVKMLLLKAGEIQEIAKEAPDRLKEEWDLFQTEVFEEADRLDAEGSQAKEDMSTHPKNSRNSGIEERIDRLRYKVAKLSEKVEAQS